MRKIHHIFLGLTLFIPVLTGCHDEPPFSVIGPSIQETEEGMISSFTLSKQHFTLPEGADSVRIALISPEGQTECFGASVDFDPENYRFHMNIPSSVKISDGEYVMTMRMPEGKGIGGRLKANFKSHELTSVSIIIPSYVLDGQGTEDDPYIIASDDDFEMFIINLGDDKESYGAGLWFRQTADVNAPDQSSYTSGRGYWGAPFAGTYDGGNHTIQGLYYRGSSNESTDSGFGTFSDLRGTATVSNLSFSNVAVSGIYKESGIIAATTSGEIELSNLTIKGHFEGSTSGNAVGGLVGCVKKGKMKISDVKFEADIRGGNDVGGLVGRSEQGTDLQISSISTPDHHFSVSGVNNVGGVIGCSKGTLNVSDARLEHTITNEDSDIRIISATGSGVGGILGTVGSGGGSHTFTHCRVLCPVGGNQVTNAGGLIGQATNGGLNLEDCRVQSVVEGKINVGGIIGKCTLAGSGCKIRGNDFDTRVSVDDAEAHVSGEENVGGFGGYWNSPLTLDAKIKINLPVSGTKIACGGVFGYMKNLTLDGSRIQIGQNSTSSNQSNTMRITGEKETGGVAGHIEGSTITQGFSFEIVSNGSDPKVPGASDYTPLLNCVVSGKERVGGVVGAAVSSSLKGINSAASVTGSSQVGGVVGYFEEPTDHTLIQSCLFTGMLNSPNANFVAGIVAYYYSNGGGGVRHNVNYGDITGGENTGGIVGYVDKRRNSNTSVIVVPVKSTRAVGNQFETRWCVNKGKINGSMYVGGIVGQTVAESCHDNGTTITDIDISISDCMNAGQVTGNGGSDKAGLGGIVGKTNFITGVYRCANHAPISGAGQFHGIGGIAGSMGDDPTGAGVTNTFRNVMLNQCVNTGTIDATDRSSFVGGLLGYQEEGNKSDVEDCHNLGEVKPDQKHDSGGIVGCVDHLTNIYRCVNQGKVYHGNAMIGTHKSGSLFDHGALYFLDGTGKNWPSATKVSSSDFKDKGHFSGLDFNNTWEMGKNGPELKNNKWRDPATAK